MHMGPSDQVHVLESFFASQQAYGLAEYVQLLGRACQVGAEQQACVSRSLLCRLS